MRQLSMFTSHNPLDFGWLAKWHPRYIGAHFQGNPFLGKPIVSRIFRNKTYLDRKFMKGTIMPEITTGGKHIESLFLLLLLVGSCCCVGRWQNSFSRSNLTTKNHQKTLVNLDFSDHLMGLQNHILVQGRLEWRWRSLMGPWCINDITNKQSRNMVLAWVFRRSPFKVWVLLQKFTQINYLRALFLNLEIRITISSAALFFDFVKTSIPSTCLSGWAPETTTTSSPQWAANLLVLLLHPMEPGRHHQAQELRKEDQFHRVHSRGVFEDAANRWQTNRVDFELKKADTPVLGCGDDWWCFFTCIVSSLFYGSIPFEG